MQDQDQLEEGLVSNFKSGQAFLQGGAGFRVGFVVQCLVQGAACLPGVAGTDFRQDAGGETTQRRICFPQATTYGPLVFRCIVIEACQSVMGRQRDSRCAGRGQVLKNSATVRMVQSLSSESEGELLQHLWFFISCSLKNIRKDGGDRGWPLGQGNQGATA